MEVATSISENNATVTTKRVHAIGTGTATNPLVETKIPRRKFLWK